MLTRTYIHIPRIGEKTERRIWDAGIRGWRDFLTAPTPPFVRAGLREHLRAGVEESLCRLESRDWLYFENALPARHKWRAYGELAGQAAFVDIETTGMNYADQITLIGIFNGAEVKTFVRGHNLEEAAAELERYPLWVTYNGAGFDLPFIRRHFPRLGRNHIHIDLRFPLKRLGYSGGLKCIERRLSIERGEATRWLDGWDAVRLWHEYLSGRDESLQLLIAYNGEDVRNLQPLMNYAYSHLQAAIENAENAVAGGGLNSEKTGERFAYLRY